MANPYFKSNKKLWDQLSETHLNDSFYNVKEFLAGANTLKKPELSLLNDLSGRSLLHLQCHFGLDSLSLARLGATVTGVDFSPVAIHQARNLSKQAKITAEFIESDVYNLTDHLDRQFDLIFTSYGVLSWLPELHKWAKIVCELLKPEGHFILVEFHPLLHMWGDDGPVGLMHDYFSRERPYEMEVTHSYTGKRLARKMKEYNWNHSLSDILNPLLRTGLFLEVFDEYDYSPYRCFGNMQERAPGEFVWDPGVRIPYLFALKMKKAITY